MNCPVCNTAAAPYVRQTNFEAYGHLEAELPPLPEPTGNNLIDRMKMSTALMSHKRYFAEIAKRNPDGRIGSKEQVTRCAKCSCAFYQDAEDLMGAIQ